MQQPATEEFNLPANHDSNDVTKAEFLRTCTTDTFLGAELLRREEQLQRHNLLLQVPMHLKKDQQRRQKRKLQTAPRVLATTYSRERLQTNAPANRNKTEKRPMLALRCASCGAAGNISFM